MVRRSKLEMYLSILEFLSLKGPSKPTHIMYKTNLCYRFLNEFLDNLIDRELVEEQATAEDLVLYAITQRGQDVVRSFRQLRKIMCEPSIRMELPPLLY